jgi:hypothetical protein
MSEDLNTSAAAPRGRLQPFIFGAVLVAATALYLLTKRPVLVSWFTVKWKRRLAG